MGWDAFGLPAENYAIKTGTHPRKTTDENIQTFKRQLQSLGFSYDWEREIDTTDPRYFQWTQWIFLKLFEHGLAYEQDLPINYCPSCKTGLANEEVLWDFSCERCWETVEKKKIRQWVLGITKYADRLLSDVDDLDWPEGIKDMQRNWIGRSEGINITYKLDEVDDEIVCYTTRPDTNFGMTFATLAPEHKLVEKHLDAFPNSEDVKRYLDSVKSKSDRDRLVWDKTKTGVFTGFHVISNLTGAKIPLYIWDFVLAHVGTWALVWVPGHDQRDFDFAKAMGIEITRVVVASDGDTSDITRSEQVQEDEWTMVNSDFLDGLEIMDAKEKIMDYFEEKWTWERVVNYKLRDWLFSRQRYWGEPIPLIHIESEDIEKLPTSPSSDAWVKDGEILMIGEKEFSKIHDGIYTKIVCDYNLPLELPDVEAYEPAGDGNSPLVNVPEFVNVELAANLNGKRETNTMPQWGGSCWYYLRFMDPDNSEKLVDPEVEKYWGQVDSYVWGAEHAVLHLLYARFWHKFLFDIGVVSSNEPFYRLRNQGLILWMSYKNAKGKLIPDDMVEEKPLPSPPLKGEGTGSMWYFDKQTGEELEKVPAKMSKSLKNVINPDDIVHEYGADTLRMYEMYMADFKDAAPWDTRSIVGPRRFLDKVYDLFIERKEKYASSDDEAMKTIHKAIKKISEDIENYKFNTAIAQLMITMNTGEPRDEVKKAEWREIFVKLLHPFAPHIAEEIWETMKEDWKQYCKIYLATSNSAKVERAKKLFTAIDWGVELSVYPDIKNVEETGATPMDCALQKIEAYKGEGIDVPIMATDSAVYFENQDFDPTHVRRAAIKDSGKDEANMSDDEICEAMMSFYENEATKTGGSFDFYYIDAWAVLFPNWEIKTSEYKRPYEMTNVRSKSIQIKFPMSNLYRSKITGKRQEDSNEAEYLEEFAMQSWAFKKLFWYDSWSIFDTSWPEYDENLVVDSEITIWVQVLGKLRGEIQISVDEDKASVLEKAKTNENVMKWLEGKELIKEIYVPGKIVNLVVK